MAASIIALDLDHLLRAVATNTSTTTTPTETSDAMIARLATTAATMAAIDHTLQGHVAVRAAVAFLPEGSMQCGNALLSVATTTTRQRRCRLKLALSV